jgi:hypothetical protein
MHNCRGVGVEDSQKASCTIACERLSRSRLFSLDKREKIQRKDAKKSKKGAKGLYQTTHYVMG